MYGATIKTPPANPSGKDGGAQERPEYMDSKMWAVAGQSYFPCEKTEEILPAGQYLVNFSDQKGIFFTRKQINLDELLQLPDSKGAQVLKSMDNFWNREKYFREHKFLWKRGIMLWGPAGSGKTSVLQQISQRIVDRGGISIYMTDAAFVAEGLRVLRTIEPTRPLVVMIEDIDTHSERGGRGESALLALLDGELQVDNVVFIATTNYPERLDRRLVNRPSRFDEIIYIGYPSAEARSMYITHKVKRLLKPKAADELKRWVEGTHNLTIAHIREVIVSVECLGNDLEVTLERLNKMNNTKLSSESGEGMGGIGFGFNAE